MIATTQIRTLSAKITNMKVESMLAVFILVGMSSTKSVNVTHIVSTKKNAVSLR